MTYHKKNELFDRLFMNNNKSSLISKKNFLDTSYYKNILNNKECNNVSLNSNNDKSINNNIYYTTFISKLNCFKKLYNNNLKENRSLNLSSNNHKLNKKSSKSNNLSNLLYSTLNKTISPRSSNKRSSYVIIKSPKSYVIILN